MQEIKVSELHQHPKNSYFFDDMAGQKWTEFLESVKTSGIIEPIVITQDKIIVSGHQRVRACKELGIDTILAEVKIYDDEDKIVKDLIETNVRQRGDISTSSLKMGRIICELERVYGIKNGRPEKTSAIGGSKSQDDIAKELGMSVDSLNRYKKLTTLIPELQDMVDEKSVSVAVASRVLARLSKEDQQAILNDVGKDQIEKMTQAQVQEYVDRIREKDNVIAGYKAKLESNSGNTLKEKDLELQKLIEEADNLKRQLNDRPVVEEKIEVVPQDYESNKKILAGYQNDYNKLKVNYDSKINEITKLKEQISTLTSATGEEQYSKKLKDSAIFFCARINDFIEKTGGFAWLSDHVSELPEYEKKSYIKAVSVMEAWVMAVKSNMEQNL